MTTPRDLLIVALDAAPPVEQGELSLALAGAELIDLLAAGVVRLEEGRIVPRDGTEIADRMLGRAAASLIRAAPYETVDDWLWRRGRGLASAYLAALEAEGALTRRRGRWLPFRTGPLVPADTPDLRLARERRASGERVLAALAAGAGIREDASGTDETGRGDRAAYDGAAARSGTGVDEAGEDEAVEAVLAAVGDASVELAAERQRRSIERDAFDNIWRGD